MGNNILTDYDDPRDTLNSAAKVLRMLQELFDGQKDDFPDEARGGVFFTLEWVVKALEHVEERLAKQQGTDARLIPGTHASSE